MVVRFDTADGKTIKKKDKNCKNNKDLSKQRGDEKIFLKDRIIARTNGDVQYRNINKESELRKKINKKHTVELLWDNAILTY